MAVDRGSAATATATAAPAQDDKRLRIVQAALRHHDFRPDSLIEVLHAAQQAYGFLSDELLVYIADQLGVPESQVFGVATFYHLFSFKPPGEHVCTVCLGTACYVKGSNGLLNAIRQAFGVETGETTPDGRLSLTVARCLGSCGLAPVLVLDGAISGQLDQPERVVELLRSRFMGEPAPAAEAEGASK